MLSVPPTTDNITHRIIRRNRIIDLAPREDGRKAIQDMYDEHHLVSRSCVGEKEPKAAITATFSAYLH
jgi:hypothetical protein